MELQFETRRSDSPWVDSVWTCTSERVTTMTSVAGVRWGLVFWKQAGQAYAGLTGPGHCAPTWGARPGSCATAPGERSPSTRPISA
ncbi:hypothetical protein JIG36_28860 [Actinoplanes sp. LDG1-06]|uniref:Uncharacterized protein n=1 Tax=Paractinoplanes ovalisporus TaxID=2810368 RepID=A0ABS2AIA5_9ACTN|nr:hypothetical protein [Actinoplanes ovalisporus]